MRSSAAPKAYAECRDPCPSMTVAPLTRVPSSCTLLAKPLFANGFIESVEPYAGDGVNGPGVLISFDFDHPASKLAPLPGTFFFGDGTYVTAFELDSSHGFTNCVVLR